MSLQRWIQNNKTAIKRLLDAVGYDHRPWARVAMYEQCFAWLRALDPAKLDALEISAGPEWRTLGFRSFSASTYPEFDVCAGALPRQFDLIIADQVFEHLLWPYRAARNIRSMLREGGHFLVTVPFLIRIHREPNDCTRWTETGLRHFLAECGFPLELVRTGAWGNRACVQANFRRWVRRGWLGSLENEPDFPVAVWALAQRGP